MKEPIKFPWLEIARLPLSMIGMLSSLLLALNFTLDLLSLFDMQWEHQFLLLILLICIAGWALIEIIILLIHQSSYKFVWDSLPTFLVLQFVVQCARLGIFFIGGAISIDHSYGLRMADFSMVLIFLPIYFLVFLLVGRALILNYTAEIESAYRKVKKSSLELKILATTDPLTGAFNRRSFKEKVEIKLALMMGQKISFSLIMFDIDYFKRINDRFGHNSGDKVLVKLTHLVQQNLRDNDVFSRWGGEEFMILLPQCNAKQAQKVAEELRLLIIAQDFDEVGRVTCSFGVAQALQDEPLDCWVDRVDRALYNVKENGRNAVCVAD